MTHQLPLATIVEKYSELHFMEGVVELALCTSSHRDPQNLGLHFYKSGQPPDDVLGQKAFMERWVWSLGVVTGCDQLLYSLCYKAILTFVC